MIASRRRGASTLFFFFSSRRRHTRLQGDWSSDVCSSDLTLSPMASWPVGAVTLMAAVPLCPSLVAVIVADPAPAPLTSPLPLTVATAVLLLPHVTTRPGRAVPFASRGVAVSCTVAPCGTLADAGVTVTDATGTFDTVTTAVPLCPSLVAVIVAVPVATAVTSPLPFTLATAPLLDCQ